jgi:nitroreductase/NAD-dependent dihydropyrimidine dehydrogenase PreA subunit
MLAFTVDATRCNRCGRCVEDCPAGIIGLGTEGPPYVAADDEAKCLACQHCLAACPHAAVSVFGLDPDQSRRLVPAELPSLAQMETLVRGRRSVRHYRDQNVDRALLDRLLRALANAPTGVNRQELTFRVVADRGELARLRQRLYDTIGAAVSQGVLLEDEPLSRFSLAWSREGRDVILRHAPHLLIVSAPPDAPCPQEDVALALAYFELLAHTAGWGTVWCGLLKRAMEALPALKPSVGLPEDQVYYPMLFGLPVWHYPRAVQRDQGAAVVWIGNAAADRDSATD